MDNHKKSRIAKPVKDMTFKEQLASLAKDPRFKELVGDIRQLSPDRQDALEDSLVAMEAQGHPPVPKRPRPVSLARHVSFKKFQKLGGISE